MHRKFIYPLLLLGLALTSWLLYLSWGHGRSGDSEILLRKMVLDSIKPEEREEVYRTFRAELTGYRLRCLWLEPGQMTVPAPLASALEHPMRPENLWEMFGAEGCASLTSLKAGEVSQPLKCKWGWAVIRVEAVESSMQEVAPALNQVLFEAHKNEYIQKLKDSALKRSQ